MKRSLLAAALIAFAAPAAADWQEDLAAQLRWDEDCKVSFYSEVVEHFEIHECTPTEQAC